MPILYFAVVDSNSIINSTFIGYRVSTKFRKLSSRCVHRLFTLVHLGDLEHENRCLPDGIHLGRLVFESLAKHLSDDLEVLFGSDLSVVKPNIKLFKSKHLLQGFYHPP